MADTKIVLGDVTLKCKYGENGYQTPAALYSSGTADPLALDRFAVVQGTEPSYNNLCDLDRLLQTATHIAAGFEANFGEVPFMAVACKHGNACGASAGRSPREVVEKAVEGDLRAVFGGLVLVNFDVDEEIAEALMTHRMDEGRRLLDGIIAPGFSEGAVEMLKRKGDKCRLLENPALKIMDRNSLDAAERYRYVRGGFLAQPNFTFVPELEAQSVERSGAAAAGVAEDMILAWAVGSTSNSNTVTLVKDAMLIGNGVGQQDRVGGCKLAIMRATDAGHDTSGAIAYSDSFFPFVDGPEALAAAGVKAILATSGSVRDGEVADYCSGEGITLFRYPDSAGRGFFGH